MQSFSLKRFGDYFAYTIRMDYRKYVIAILALLGLLFMFIILPVVIDSYEYEYTHDSMYYQNDPMYGYMQALFIMGVLLVMSFAASMTFADLSKKEGRISSLMLPATQLEKYTVRLLIFLPISLIVGIVVFEFVDIIRFLIVHFKYGAFDRVHIFLPVFLKDLGSPETSTVLVFCKMLSVLLVCQSLFVLGSIVWPRLSWIKTMSFLAVFSFILVWVGIGAFSVFINPEMSYGPSWEEDISPNTVLWASVCFDTIVSAFFLILAYYRYKEIEIIQRW